MLFSLRIPTATTTNALAATEKASSTDEIEVYEMDKIEEKEEDKELVVRNRLETTTTIKDNHKKNHNKRTTSTTICLSALDATIPNTTSS